MYPCDCCVLLQPSRLLQMGTTRWLKLKYMSSGILIIMFTFFMLSFTVNDTVGC